MRDGGWRDLPLSQAFSRAGSRRDKPCTEPVLRASVRLVGAGCLFVLLAMHARVCGRACDTVLPELIARGILATGKGDER